MSKQDPKTAALLSDPEALKTLLQSPEAKALAAAFQKAGGPGLQSAAKSAAAGDGAALRSILDRVAADPEGARAMAAMDRKTGK